MLKKTLVLGASLNPERYSFLAVERLRQHEFPVIAFGRKPGKISDVDIVTEFPDSKDIHTITIYLSEQNQAPFIEKIILLHPKRVIFNPGAENPAFMQRLHEVGIDGIEACTLVMLSTGLF